MKLIVPFAARFRRASLASVAIPSGSSGNQTPGCVLPSSIAITNEDVAVPTDRKLSVTK